MPPKTLLPRRDPRPTKKRRTNANSENDSSMAFSAHTSAPGHPRLLVPSAPSSKPSQRILGRVKKDIDAFLSSDVERELERSFASTMSIHSPQHDHIPLSPEESREYVPMDISPAPQRAQRSSAESNYLDVKPRIGRPRALTSSDRLFGRDVSNGSSDIAPAAGSKAGHGTSSKAKNLQRSALPFEWMSTASSVKGSEHTQPQDISSSPSSVDAMDVDSSFVYVPPASIAHAHAPPSAAPTITAFNVERNPLAEDPPLSSAPTITKFNHMLFKDRSPERDQRGTTDFGYSNAFDISVSPSHPFPKKRRSASPTGFSPGLEPEEVSISEDAPLSSPSAHKLERMASGPLLGQMKKPMLGGLGAPLALNANNKRPRRPVLSAMITPGEVPSMALSAYPITSDGHSKDKENATSRLSLPPVRRAFSAVIPPNLLEQSMSSEDGSMFDDSIEGPDMSSPAAQAYAKRQQVKTIRRCDGTDDFRPLTGASALVTRDQEVMGRTLKRSEERGSRKSEEKEEKVAERDTPRSKYLRADRSGLGSFGDNEAHGKILPCHRVREDGLMRITVETLNALLDGAYDSIINSFHVIDCRFDYEYNGGHIPGALNINTTAGVEEFLLGPNALKPKPSTSGDAVKKTVLIFHCEFSAKRAPTFAKHLRSKDRAMNNHVYPKVHFPEVYILEGGYCQYFKCSAPRCEPSAYVKMDDPHFAASRREDLDQFRKARFGRTKSYAYGDGKMSLSSQLQQHQEKQKRNTAPSGALFAAVNAAPAKRGGGCLQTLQEDSSGIQPSEDEDTDIGESPCPPPNKNVMFKGGKLGRVPLLKANTYDPRMTIGC